MDEKAQLKGRIKWSLFSDGEDPLDILRRGSSWAFVWVGDCSYSMKANEFEGENCTYAELHNLRYCNEALKEKRYFSFCYKFYED